MADEPVIADGNEHVSVAPVVVETDLGEDSEVAGDPRLVRCYVGEADIRHVVAHDSLHTRRLGCRVRCCDGSAEELEDRGSAADRLAAAELELAVFTKALGELV